MSLRRELKAVIERRDFDELEALLDEPAAVQYLLGGTYHSDPDRREFCARGLARAATHHEELVARVVRQLVWAMNDESGTNAVSAPGALLALARERSDLLLGVVPDLVRLTEDDGLAEGLQETLQIIAREHPGEIGARLGKEMTRELQDGRRVL